MGHRNISVSAARPKPGKPWEISLFHGSKGGRVDECQGAGLSCTLFEQVFE